MSASAADRASSAADAWPALQAAESRETYTTLHLWTQIVGKTRLALAPMVNHWWQVTLYVTPRGLTTSAMPVGTRSLEVEFDFLSSELVLRASDGGRRTMRLAPRSVADFHAEYLGLLGSLGVDAKISSGPSEVADPIPFATDTVHASYDAEAARCCWRALLQADRLLKEFRGRFLGKCSPVHFWWGGFDIACTRFSGRKAPTHPGGIPHMPDWVTREAYSHECISAGWWLGSPGSPVEDPAFYAYSYAEPPGCPEAIISPPEARYEPAMREWILPYEAVRRLAEPDRAVLAFLQSTYDAAADRGSWDRRALERSPPV